MAYAKIRPRRGTATQWRTANPVLLEGEQGIEVPDSGIGTGVVKIKFGDGVSAWNDLPYGVLSTDPVDNLLSEATDLPLSANQGRVLLEKMSKWEDVTDECASGSTVSTDNTKVYKDGNTLIVCLEAVMNEEIPAKTNEWVFCLPEKYTPNVSQMVFNATTLKVGGQHLRVVLRGKKTDTELYEIGDIWVSGGEPWKNVGGTLIIPLI